MIGSLNHIPPLLPSVILSLESKTQDRPSRPSIPLPPFFAAPLRLETIEHSPLATAGCQGRAHRWPSRPPHCESTASISQREGIAAGASERASERARDGRELAANRGLRGHRHRRGPVGAVPHARGGVHLLSGGHRARRVRRERDPDVAVCARPVGVLPDDEPGE